MKQVKSVIPILTIGEINTDAGKEQSGQEFHVTRSSEIAIAAKYTRPVRGDHYAFLLITAGTMTMKYNLIDYTLAVNSLFLIAPGMIHELNPRQNPDGQLIGIGFSPEFLAQSLVHKKHIGVFSFLSSQSAPHLLLNPAEANALQNLMLILQKSYSYEDHPFKADIMFHGFNLFMLEIGTLFKKYQLADSIKFTRKEEHLMQFFKLLALHFKEERSVQYYAGLMFISPKHLTKTIKELTSKTCGEFIDEMVIAEAKILLDDHSLSVGNVAEQLHFSDQFFFSKFFKNFTGVSPLQYKTAAM